MLRTAKTNRVAARLMGLRGTTTTGTPVASWGGGDYSSYTDNGTGDTTCTFVEPFPSGRVPVVVATAGADVDATNGAFASVSSALVTAARVVTSANDGTAADGAAHAIVWGWDVADTGRSVMEQRVHCTGLRPRLIPISLSDPSTLVEGKYLCSVTASSNESTIVFNQAFQAAPVVVASADTAGNTVNIVSVTAAQVVITQFDSSGAATTGGVYLWVYGQDCTVDVGKRRRALKVAQIRPRILAGRITVTGGTPAITGFTDLGTVTDNGQGDFTLTFEKAFKRAPVVVAAMSSVGSVAVTASTTSTCRLVCQTNAGAAVDPTTVHVLVCGFDYAGQC